MKTMMLFALTLAASLAINTSVLARSHSSVPTWGSSNTVQLQAKEKRKSKAKARASWVEFHRGSEEDTPDRDRRLKRECKGRPNSGACLGFAN